MNASSQFNIAIIAGEASGDFLGAKLIKEINKNIKIKSYFGVGGENMIKEGFNSLFLMEKISIIGPLGILYNIKSLLKKINLTKDYIIKNKPNVLVIIDCPEFSHRVALKVKKYLPDIIVINYVSPTIWAWRRKRATNMKKYIDHVLSILPFEENLYKELNGPKCTYIGHPLIEEFNKNIIAKDFTDIDIKSRKKIKLIVMPGSRFSEVKKLLNPFGKSLFYLSKLYPDIEIVIPTLNNLKDYIEKNTTDWTFKPLIITSDKQKKIHMREADAAIVCSGTATLELALIGLPMVVAYKTQWIVSFIRFLIPVKSIVLANIIHGGFPIKELFQWNCNGKKIANEIIPLLEESHERITQLAALDDISKKMYTKDNNPSREAAKIVMNYLM